MTQAEADRTGPEGPAEGRTVTLDENGGDGGQRRGAGTGGGPQGFGAQSAGRPQDAWGAADDWSEVGSAVDAESEAGSGAASGTGETGGDDGDREAGTDGVRRRSDDERTWWRTLAVPFVAAWRFAFPKKPRSFLLELPFLLGIALVLAFLIKTFLVQAFVIPSGSMQNTLQINDRVLVNRFANWMGDEPNRGDVVVFQDPGGWLDAEPTKPKNLFSKTLTAVGLLPEDNGDLIKRVIGVAGDHVDCDGDGKPVLVNGVPLQESAYLHPDSVGQPSMQPFHVVVPPGHLWVMGDHRSVSMDSRPNEARQPGAGMVPVSKVVGIAVLKVWPPSHWGTLPVPQTFQQSFKALAAPGAVPAAAFGVAVPLTVVLRRRRLRKVRVAAEG